MWASMMLEWRGPGKVVEVVRQFEVGDDLGGWYIRYSSTPYSMRDRSTT
jgi:hypothetical protein